MPGFELFGEAERQEVNDVLNCGVLMRYGFESQRQGHWKAKAMESELCKQLGVKHAQLLSSGTAAVTSALAVAGIGAGDEVIVPAFTFVASFEAVLMTGATPVLVNVDDTLTMSPKAVTKAITSRTKAIMPVHMCGSMADLDALKSICQSRGLFLIEDACQAIGGKYKGHSLGTIGDMGCFSFDAVKTVTCGEGGAVVTNNGRFAELLDQYSDHGHDHLGFNRGTDDHPIIGYNFRISELNAAVGLAQTQRLPEFLKIQKEHYTILRSALTGISGLTFRRIPEGGEESCAFLNFFLPTVEVARLVMELFSEQAINDCFHYLDNNWHYINKWNHLKNGLSANGLNDFQDKGLARLSYQDFSQSNQWIGRNISCLIKVGWTNSEVEQRAATMATILRKVLSESPNIPKRLKKSRVN